MFSFITGPLNVTRTVDNFADALTECALAVTTVDHRAGSVELDGTTVATMGTNGIAFPVAGNTESERLTIMFHNEALIDSWAEARAGRHALPLESERV